ncbi:MAG: hypothetical protein IH888_04885 [Planctomycetes bacterium]|nr:hypothetical protein [Planctomycetota bacterium]
MSCRVASGGVASGQVQFKAVDAAGDLVSQLHGNVTCVAETTAVAGSQGWEIRFVVTHSAGPFPVPIGDHGSIFVQDNPTGDMVDESFDDLGNSSCGDNDDDVTWEPMLKGDIKVRS